MWILLEGKPSAVRIAVDPSEYTEFNLDKLKPILQEKFPKLQNVEESDIEFLYYNDRTTPLRSGMILTNDITTDENPFVVRYPFSESHSK